MRYSFLLITVTALLFISPLGFSETPTLDQTNDTELMPDPEPPDKTWMYGLEPDTLHVPADYPTIQAAIDAARNGDVVLVSPGTYMENINFNGKLIIVMSSEGPLATTIDGGSPADPKKASVVTFNHGEGNRAVISGFQITNGTGTEILPLGYHCGGGIICHYASPTITNNIIVRNKAFDPPEMQSPHGGTGIAGNASPGSAGQGMMHPEQAAQSKLFSTDKSNIGVGGGIGCYESAALIINNILCLNFSETKGGAIACSRANIQVINNTVTENLSGTGGSIYASTESRVTIKNSIFWGNDSNEGEEWAIRSFSSFIISFTDLDGGMEAVRLGPNSTINWGAGMIDAEPIFESGPKSDFYLSHDTGLVSPCIDAGSGFAGLLGFSTSWTRVDKIPDYGIVDMGFHYGPHAPQASFY
ncbi:MAG: hypothetical protein ABIK28_19365 [Planctomycetota bacterium]